MRKPAQPRRDTYEVSKLELFAEYLTAVGVVVARPGFVVYDKSRDGFHYLGSQHDVVQLLEHDKDYDDDDVVVVVDSTENSNANDQQRRQRRHVKRAMTMDDMRDNPSFRLHVDASTATAAHHNLVRVLEKNAESRRAFRVFVQPENALGCTRIRVYWHVFTNRNLLTKRVARWLVRNMARDTLQEFIAPLRQNENNSSDDDGGGGPVSERTYVLIERRQTRAEPNSGERTPTEESAARLADAAVGANRSNIRPWLARTVSTERTFEVYVFRVPRKRLWRLYERAQNRHAQPPEASPSAPFLPQQVQRTIYNLNQRCQSPNVQYILAYVCSHFALYLNQRVALRAFFPPHFADVYEHLSSGADQLPTRVRYVPARCPFVLDRQQGRVFEWLCGREQNYSQTVDASRISMLRIASTNWFYDCAATCIVSSRTHPSFTARGDDDDDDDDSDPPHRSFRQMTQAPLCATCGPDTPDPPLVDVGRRRVFRRSKMAINASFLCGGPSSGKRTAILAHALYGDAGFSLAPWLSADAPSLGGRRPQQRRRHSTRQRETTTTSTLLARGVASDDTIYTVANDVSVVRGGNATRTSLCSGGGNHRLQALRTARRTRDASSMTALQRALSNASLRLPLVELFVYMVGPPPTNRFPTCSDGWSRLRCAATLLLCPDANVDRWIAATSTFNGGRLERGRRPDWFHVLDNKRRANTNGRDGGGGGGGGGGDALDDACADARTTEDAQDGATVLFRVIVVRTLREYWRLQYADLLTCDVVLLTYELVTQLSADACSYMSDFAAAESALPFDRSVWMQCLKHYMNTEEQRWLEALCVSVDGASFHDDALPEMSLGPDVDHNVPLEAIAWRRVLLDDLDTFRQRCNAAARHNGRDVRNRPYQPLTMASRENLATLDRFLSVLNFERLTVVSSSVLHTGSLCRDYAPLVHRLVGAKGTLYPEALLDCARQAYRPPLRVRSRAMLAEHLLYVSPPPRHAVAARSAFDLMCQLQDLQGLRELPVANSDGSLRVSAVNPLTGQSSGRYALRYPSSSTDRGTPAVDGDAGTGPLTHCFLMSHLKSTYRYMLHWVEHNARVAPIIINNLSAQLLQRASRFMSQINVDYANAEGVAPTLEGASKPFHAMLRAAWEREQRNQHRTTDDNDDNGDNNTSNENESTRVGAAVVGASETTTTSTDATVPSADSDSNSTTTTTTTTTTAALDDAASEDGARAWAQFMQDAFGTETDNNNNNNNNVAPMTAVNTNDNGTTTVTMHVPSFLRDEASAYDVRRSEWTRVVDFDPATSVGYSRNHDRLMLLQRSESLSSAATDVVHPLPYTTTLTTVRDRHALTFLMTLARSTGQTLSTTDGDNVLEEGSNPFAVLGVDGDVDNAFIAFSDLAFSNNDGGGDSTNDSEYDDDEVEYITGQDSMSEGDGSYDTDLSDSSSADESDSESSASLSSAAAAAAVAAVDNNDEVDASSSPSSSLPSSLEDGQVPRSEPRRVQTRSMTRVSTDQQRRRDPLRNVVPINDYRRFYLSLHPTVLADQPGPFRLTRNASRRSARTQGFYFSDGRRHSGSTAESQLATMALESDEAAAQYRNSNRNGERDGEEDLESAASAVRAIRGTNQTLTLQYDATLRALKHEQRQTAELLVNSVRMLIAALLGHPAKPLTLTRAERRRYFHGARQFTFDRRRSTHGNGDDGTLNDGIQDEANAYYDFYAERLAGDVLQRDRLSSYEPPLSVNVSYLSSLITKLRRDTQWIAIDVDFVCSQRRRLVQNNSSLEQALIRLDRSETSESEEECPVCLCGMENVRALYPCGHYCCWECHAECNNDVHRIEDEEEPQIGAAEAGLRCFQCRYVLQRGEDVRRVDGSAAKRRRASAPSAPSSGSSTASGSSNSTSTSTSTSSSSSTSTSSSSSGSNDGAGASILEDIIRPALPPPLPPPPSSPTPTPDNETVLRLQRRLHQRRRLERTRARRHRGTGGTTGTTANGRLAAPPSQQAFAFVKTHAVLHYLQHELKAARRVDGGGDSGTRRPVRVVVFSQFMPLLTELATALDAWLTHNRWNNEVDVYTNASRLHMLRRHRGHRPPPMTPPSAAIAVSAVGGRKRKRGEQQREASSRSAPTHPVPASAFVDVVQPDVPVDAIFFHHVDLTHHPDPKYLARAPPALTDVTHVIFAESLCPRLTHDARAHTVARQIEAKLVDRLQSNFSRYDTKTIRFIINGAVDEHLYLRQHVPSASTTTASHASSTDRAGLSTDLVAHDFH